MYTYRPASQLFARFWNFSQPAPAHRPTAWGMEEVKVITIANARDSTKETPVAKEVGSNIGRSRYTAKVICVQLQGSKTREREQNRRRPLFGGSERIRVRAA